jgi:hypothetical protein
VNITIEVTTMDTKSKVAAGAGVLAVAVALGYVAYQQPKPITYRVLVNTVTVRPIGTMLRAGAPVAPVTGVPAGNANLPVPALAPVAVPSMTEAENNARLSAENGIYAPNPGAVGNNVSQSSVTRASSTYTQTQTNGAPMVEQQTTTTSVKTAYVQPSTTVHTATIYRRVRHEKPGNIHVARAVKHTIGFTAALPKRLRF